MKISYRFKNIRSQTNLKFSNLVLAFCLTIMLVSGGLPIAVRADPLPGSELQALDNYPNWTGFQCSADDQATDNNPPPGSVYMLGDSITFGAKDELANAFGKASFDSSYITARQSRSLSSPGSSGNALGTPDSYHTGLDQINVDAATYISKAQSIVIALGTNQEIHGSFNNNVKAAINEINNANPNHPSIYWVNIFSHVSQKSNYNKTLDNLASSQGFTVIDAASSNPPISLSGDDVHPDTNGQQQFAQVIVGALTASPSTGGTTNTTPISINGPFKPKAYPGDTINVNDAYKGTASTYGNDPVTGFVDPGDVDSSGKPLEPALPGATNAQPGIAVYNHGSRGGWWAVIAPNGKSAILQQMDIGPSTSRIVDINSVAARAVFGYKEGNNFPTGEGNWKIQYMGKTQPPNAITSESDTGKSAPAPADNCCPGGGDSGSTALSGSDNAQKAFNYFVGQGLSPGASAGLVGNFQQESGPSLNTHSDNGSHVGIAQWDTGGRWANLLKHERGKDPYALATQLDFVWYELNGSYRQVLGKLKRTNDPKVAADIVFSYYEKPGDSTEPAREANAIKILQDNGGSTSGGAVDSNGGCSTSSATKPNFIDLSGPASDPMAHGKLSKINALVIHYTEGNSEGKDLRDFFVNQNKGYGVQFNIGSTGKVYQYFALDNMQETWHVGDINSHSIGIEITGMDGAALLNNQAQFDSVVTTVKFLCSNYSIPCSSPKGDITGDHNNPDQAQGLLGHDEAPNPGCGNDCNHSDPDTRISNGVEYNIKTGRVWSNSDRRDSSTHAYMMKLRQALGYDPTPK